MSYSQEPNMSYSHQLTEMRRSLTRKTLAKTREILLSLTRRTLVKAGGILFPETTDQLLNSYQLTFMIFVPLMEPETIRMMLPRICYLTLGMYASMFLSLTLDIGDFPTGFLSLVDTAFFVRASVPGVCLWVLLQASLMAILADKQIFDRDDGGKVLPMSEWLTQLAHKFPMELRRLFQESRNLVADIGEWVRTKGNGNPQPVPVALPEGRQEHRLREWEIDLQAREGHLREAEDGLQAWDDELHQRDDSLQELEVTLREWEDGLRELLEQLRGQADELRECEE